MTGETDETWRGNGWRQGTIALLAGLAAFSGMVYHVTVLQTPEVSPPVRMAPLLVFVTVFAAVALPLVWWDHRGGYAASVLAGALAVATIALFLLGALGPVKTGPGPLVYALFGAVLVIVTVVAWRERAGPAS